MRLGIAIVLGYWLAWLIGTVWGLIDTWRWRRALKRRAIRYE
jgi:hypothetical protein